MKLYWWSCGCIDDVDVLITIQSHHTLGFAPTLHQGALTKLRDEAPTSGIYPSVTRLTGSIVDWDHRLGPRPVHGWKNRGGRTHWPGGLVGRGGGGDTTASMVGDNMTLTGCMVT
uniref:Uncharacterized protein n=1 Tax=Oryza brachyantha TaxID=4533 RepID=J3M5X6_ORYBR